MRPYELKEGGATAHDHDFQRRDLADDAALVAGICSRLVEWREISDADKPIMFLRKLVKVAAADRTPSGLKVKGHPAFWLVVGTMSGDLEVLSKSFRELGREQNRTKQAVQQENSRCLQRISAIFPALAKTLDSLHLHSWNAGLHTAVALDENGNPLAPADVVAPVVPLKRKRGRPRKEVDDPEVATMLAELKEDLAKPVPVYDEPDEVEA